MTITKQTVAVQIAAYLHHQITLGELVDCLTPLTPVIRRAGASGSAMMRPLNCPRSATSICWRLPKTGFFCISQRMWRPPFRAHRRRGPPVLIGSNIRPK